MGLFILVKNEFIGFHRWEDAPEEQKFLRSLHRHLFKVETKLWVKHTDRDIEFFDMQDTIQEYFKDHYEGQEFEESCEMIAKKLYDILYSKGYEVKEIVVYEDGENGGGYDG